MALCSTSNVVNDPCVPGKIQGKRREGEVMKSVKKASMVLVLSLTTGLMIGPGLARAQESQPSVADTPAAVQPPSQAPDQVPPAPPAQPPPLSAGQTQVQQQQPV